jgi:hypothetical protein
MYQLQPDILTGQPAQCIKRMSDNAFIPYDNANTDYAQFKVDLENGVPLQDADGNNMTRKQIEEFLSTLP